MPIADYNKGKRESKLIDLASIDKVPISMFSGTLDDTCPFAQAQETAAIIGDKIVNLIPLEYEDHYFFGSAQEEWFMDMVYSQL